MDNNLETATKALPQTAELTIGRTGIGVILGLATIGAIDVTRTTVRVGKKFREIRKARKESENPTKFDDTPSQ